MGWTLCWVLCVHYFILHKPYWISIIKTIILKLNLTEGKCLPNLLSSLWQSLFILKSV